MPREWPNFLEKNLHAQIKAARLRSSLEHPEMHKHADDYGRLLHQSFSLHHDLAFQALLKIHDAGRGRKPLEAIAEAYGQRLVEYRKTKSIALRNFLHRVREELQARKVNVEPPEPEEKTDPLAIISQAAAREKAIEEKLREILKLRNHDRDESYEDIIKRAQGEEMQMALLQHALMRRVDGIKAGKKGFHVSHRKADSARQIITQAGFHITSEKAADQGWYHFEIEPSQRVLDFLRNYLAKPR